MNRFPLASRVGRSVALAGACLLLAAAPATSQPFPINVAADVYGVLQGGVVNGIPTANDDNDGRPDINDAINLLQDSIPCDSPAPPPPSLAHNVDADPLFVAPDDVWLEVNGTVMLIGLTAAANNSLGVYSDLGVGALKTPLLGPFSGFGCLGDGSSANPFPAALTHLGTGAPFGWYLNTDAVGVVDYFSEPFLNPSRFDHMMTFDLPGADGRVIWVDMGSGPTPVELVDPFLLAWEDLPWNGATLGDDDYDDMLYLVDKVSPNPVPVDIKPASCPNPFNVGKKGVVPVAVVGTGDLDVRWIDPASVRLAGVPPKRWAFADVATPFPAVGPKEDCFLDCHDAHGDGLLDLTLKFDARQLAAALGAVSDRQCLVVVLTGRFKPEHGGAPFAGDDVLRILAR